MIARIITAIACVAVCMAVAIGDWKTAAGLTLLMIGVRLIDKWIEKLERKP